jgi:hypothetical protein
MEIFLFLQYVELGFAIIFLIFSVISRGIENSLPDEKKTFKLNYIPGAFYCIICTASLIFLTAKSKQKCSEDRKESDQIAVVSDKAETFF